MSGFCLDCEPLTISDFSFGVTDAALRAVNYLRDDIELYTRSVTAPIRKKEEILSELIETQDECSMDDWDEEGASAISMAALLESITFINSLPAHLELPDVSPSANGAINFEWRKGAGLCNVELFGDNEIVYSAYFSRKNRDYGMKPFIEKIPDKVIELVESLS